MQELISHIEYLLTQHDCVILPGLGGFVLRYKEAMISVEGQLTPPCKDVSFNGSLVHNDGLLANSLMQDKNLNFAEAMIFIEAKVKDLRCRLLTGQMEELNSLGRIYLGKENEIIFEPCKTNCFDLDCFGLPEIFVRLSNAPQGQVLSEKAAEIEDPNLFLLPVDLRFVRKITAIAAIIISLLFVSHPLEQENMPENYASVISSELINRAIMPGYAYYQNMANAPQQVLTNESDSNFNEINADLDIQVEYPLVDNLQENEIKTEEATSPRNIMSEKPLQSKFYYVIVGSFPTENQAEKRIEYLRKKGVCGVRYILKDKKYRLYLDRFEDKGSANKYLSKLRSEYSIFADAWLLAHIS